jgi:hypothetical protein
MKPTKPRSRKPKAKQRPVPYGYLRKNGRLVIDPRKKALVKKMYGKLVKNPELILEIEKLIADMVRAERSKVAKLAYQRRSNHLQQGEK